MNLIANDLETGPGLIWQTLKSLDRQAGELTDRTAAYAFDDISDAPSHNPWVARGLVERLIQAMSGGGTAAPARQPVAQPFSAVSSPGAN